MSVFYEKHATDEPVIRFEIKNFDFPSHLHKEIELVQVLSGTCTMVIEQRTFEFSAGNIAIVFPHSIHSYHFSHDYRAMLFIVDPKLYSEYDQLLANYLPENPIVSVNDELLANFHATQLPTNDFRDVYLRNARWRLIFALMFQQMTFAKRESTDVSLTHKILTYLANHYREPLAIQDLALRLNCNVFTVSKIFSKKVGISFPLYLAHLRIAFAKQLLESTDETITDIAFSSGFETQRSFNRTFLKLTGQTPRAYRKEYAQLASK